MLETTPKEVITHGLICLIILIFVIEVLGVLSTYLRARIKRHFRQPKEGQIIFNEQENIRLVFIHGQWRPLTVIQRKQYGKEETTEYVDSSAIERESN